MNEPWEWPIKHDAAAAVVVLEIVPPRVAYVVVLRAVAQRGAAATAGDRRAQAGERDLTIEWRVLATRRSESRELLSYDVELGGIRMSCR